jgi:hypothetical protein
MSMEDEDLLRHAFRVERTTVAEVQAIARVERGLMDHSFVPGGRGRRLKILASLAVFIVWRFTDDIAAQIPVYAEQVAW